MRTIYVIGLAAVLLCAVTLAAAAMAVLFAHFSTDHAQRTVAQRVASCTPAMATRDEGAVLQYERLTPA